MGEGFQKLIWILELVSIFIMLQPSSIDILFIWCCKFILFMYWFMQRWWLQTRPKQTRIVNLYRPFNPKQMSEMTFFCNQITKLVELVINNTIIVGDLNLDLNKEFMANYARKNYFTLMKNIILSPWINTTHIWGYMVQNSKWSKTELKDWSPVL